MKTSASKATPKPTRGRPAQSEEALSDRRAEIASVALRLFKEEGYMSVSMRRLGKEVGLTPMALYRYFPSKSDILSTLWADILSNAFKDVAAAALDAQDPKDQLHRASLAYVNYWFENVEHYRLVFMNAGVANVDVRSFVSQVSVIEAYDIFFDSVAQIMDLVRDDPQVKTATDSLVCHLHGIMHSLITMQGYAWTPREALVQQAVQGALGGTKGSSGIGG